MLRGQRRTLETWVLLNRDGVEKFTPRHTHTILDKTELIEKPWGKIISHIWKHCAQSSAHPSEQKGPADGPEQNVVIHAF